MDWKLIVFVACAVCAAARAEPLRRAAAARGAAAGVPSWENRTACAEGDPAPPNRVLTGARVMNLITKMEAKKYAAYIIPPGDAHQSEYIAEADARRAYISGFDGSAGTAVVLADGTRALWTDGRYFLQADAQLDCEWLLMREEQPGVPTIVKFLMDNLNNGDVVSADASLLPYKEWLDLKEELATEGIDMEKSATNANLVDEVWDEDSENPRPAYSEELVILHPIEFTGKDVDEKLAEVRTWMEDQKVDALVVTALDEVAWLYNLRGFDIPYNPVFAAYSIVTKKSANVYVNLTKVEDVTADGSFENVEFKDYEQFFPELLLVAKAEAKVALPASTYSDGCSFQVYDAVAPDKRVMAATPTLLLKARKNAVEIEVMKEDLIKDGVALTSFLAFLTKQIEAGEKYTEVSAQNLLKEYRANQTNFMIESFGTISSFGPNGAVIHYKATADTDTPIDNSSLYLLDSGGQYKGATSDITRTLHFGTPTAEMVDKYTRVLQGSIDFVQLHVPQGTKRSGVDILARRPLFNDGKNYRHGTSHGIGSCLNVHEPLTEYVEEGNVASDEPGYYVDGEWGIRIENQVLTVNSTFEFDVQYLTFETVSLAPLEPKLIDVSMLTDAQVEWLNAYNAEVREKVGGRMQEGEGMEEAYQYLLAKTEPVQKEGGDSGAGGVVGSVALVMMSLAVLQW